MLGLLKKKVRQNLVAAVCPAADGIAVAQIRRERDIPPVLEMCAYQQLDPDRSETAILGKLVNEHHLDQRLCVSMVELGTYSLLMVEAPDVQPDELRAAVRWRIKDLIDFHIDDAVIDVFEVPDTKTAGRNKMMYAVVARSSLVKHRIDQLLDAGVNLNVVDIPELALRNISSLLPEDVGGVALVYLGPDRGLITITRQGILYLSRRIEKGTNSLPDTAMLANDSVIVEDWLDGIIIEIQRSLDYYESHFALPQVSSLVVTPLPRELPRVGEYISEQLGIPSRMLDINHLIDTQEPVDAALQSRCLLAIGAALRQESVAL